jgi:hypothetical protein
MRKNQNLGELDKFWMSKHGKSQILFNHLINNMFVHIYFEIMSFLRVALYLLNTSVTIFLPLIILIFVYFFHLKYLSYISPTIKIQL